MKNYNPDKAVIVRDAPELVIMLCAHLDNGEKPDLLHIVGGEVWITDWDTYFDAGMEEDNTRFMAINGAMTKPQTDARIAWEYFYNGADSGEYGEPWSEAENKHRKQHFAALASLLLGHKFIFKDKEVA